MKFDVSFRPHAAADLTGIYDFVAGVSSQAAAESFISRITAACTGLSEFPERGRLESRLGAGIRLLTSVNWITIAYRVGGSVVRMLRVFYAGRDNGSGDFET